MGSFLTHPYARKKLGLDKKILQVPKRVEKEFFLSLKK
jgi:hypothetical protein